MNRFKISSRLIVAFSIMVLLLIALAGIGLWRSAQQRAELADVLQRRAVLSKSLNIVFDQVNEEAILVRNLALFSSSATQQSWLERIAAGKRQVEDQFKTIDTLVDTREGQAMLAKMKASRAAFVAAGEQYLALLQQGRRDEALVLLEDSYRTAQRAYHGDIQEELALQEGLAKQAGERAEASGAALQRDILIAAVVAVLAAIVLALGIIGSIIGPLRRAVAVCERIAGGDLSAEIEVHSQDETGQLLRAMQQMQSSLATTVGLVRRNAEGVASASVQIASGNNDLSARTEEQAAALEQTASSMEELGSTVRQNAEHARTANELAVQASTVAAQGGAVVAEVVDTMKSINASSARIADIISVIDGIAFQTNILALNAAVEAARAGEQGRGFAVVASEVRTLAQRSAVAAKDIKALIAASVATIDSGSASVQQAGERMGEIVKSVQQVSDIIARISAASAEQAQGIAEVNQAVGQMDDVTQQNAALVEQAAAAATSLQDQAVQLSQAVSVFKLEDRPETSPVSAHGLAHGLAQEARAGQHEAPRQFHGLRNPDARPR